MQGAGGVGGLLAEKQGGNFYCPTYDGNGNVSEYLTATGTITAHLEYDSFGNTVVNTDFSKQFSYRFSTKPLDFLTGVYYYTLRWYDPLIGRWPSRDPIGENGGINLYGYVGNDGIDGLDILGLKADVNLWKTTATWSGKWVLIRVKCYCKDKPEEFYAGPFASGEKDYFHYFMNLTWQDGYNAPTISASTYFNLSLKDDPEDKRAQREKIAKESLISKIAEYVHNNPIPKIGKCTYAGVLSGGQDDPFAINYSHENLGLIDVEKGK